ncbi:MAG: GNAT family N-acetyltransferase [Pikeienuella sp.]
MSGLEIRRPNLADEAAWRRLWTGYLDFYETGVSEEVYATTWARLLSEADGDYHGFVADREGVLVGLVHYIYHRHGWRVERVTYLQDLYVAPSARGTGAGRALIEAVYGAADAAGCPAVYWLTQDFNTTARQLYDRIGKATPFIKYTR